jgi:hypothetical protein
MVRVPNLPTGAFPAFIAVVGYLFAVHDQRRGL